MATIDLEKLKAHRVQSFRLLPEARLKTLPQAVDFVNERGYIFFWPITGMDLPSLWTAVAGERPVPSAHDDPGHISWDWKDKSLGKKIWYYAKILHRKATFISNSIVPYFYALSGNYGSPEEDYLLDYKEGKVTLAAKQIYEALLNKGALDTISLKKEARLTNTKESEFKRAMEDLQRDFKIMPIGVAEAGAWRYAFRYEITTYVMPELPVQARLISEETAQEKVLELYFRSVGATQLRNIIKLLGWDPEKARRTVDRLIQRKVIKRDLSHPHMTGEWVALSGLIE